MTLPAQSNPSVHCLLICSVGGTHEPIVASLLHWRPAAVRFVVSTQSCSQVDTVLRSYAEHAGQALSPGCYEFVTVDDAEDLGRVVAALRPLAEDVQQWKARGGDYEVVVDFTAGTKCMSAALALVARRWPCQFSYVGGSRRSKDGVGVVESGSERLVRSENPWDTFGYQLIDDAVTVFNHGGYAAAAALLRQAIHSATHPAVKRELSTLQAVAEAYAAWDRFDHPTARQRFDDALKNRNDLAAVFPNAQQLIRTLEQHRVQVDGLAEQTEPTTAWVEDLFHNALRRAAECRYDDAVARLYRAFEALAQVRLREQYGIADTKSVPVDKLPDDLRLQWQARAHDGAIFLGLRDAYALLQACQDELGLQFANLGLGGEHSPLVARNQSILAHGFQPVSETVYNSLCEKLSELGAMGRTESQVWRLPRPR